VHAWEKIEDSDRGGVLCGLFSFGFLSVLLVFFSFRFSFTMATLSLSSEFSVAPMEVEAETPTYLESIMARTDLTLQQRIDLLLNELFGDLESELDEEPETTANQESDEYDGYEEPYECYEAEEDSTPCACNYSRCQGDCGTLRCGCIDVCRGRCGFGGNDDY
jgi:hypothetical protein